MNVKYVRVLDWIGQHPVRTCPTDEKEELCGLCLPLVLDGLDSAG